MMMGSWLLFLVVIIGAIYLFTKPGGYMTGPRETPLDILKKRYAQGEITKEELEEKKKDLGL